MDPLQIRKQMTDALRLDLVGPEDGLGSPKEILPEPPSRWYLTGFIVPLDADDDQKADETSTEEVDEVTDGKGADDAAPPEPAAARRSFFPSSIGLSILVSAKAKTVKVLARWGDYKTKRPEDGQGVLFHWQRIPYAEEVVLD